MLLVAAILTDPTKSTMRQAFRILLALFALFLLSAHAQEAVVEEEAPAPMSRRLFSFWSLLFLASTCRGRLRARVRLSPLYRPQMSADWSAA